MVQIEYVLGNTGCLHFGGSCIPFYETSKNTWILMDSGARFIRSEFDEYLKKHKIRVRAVLCSHAHFDHTENNRFLQEYYGAELFLSACDAGILHDATSLKTVFYSYTGMDNSVYNEEMMCLADRLIDPGQKKVIIDDAEFQILDLPGHSASQIGFVTPDGVAYLADSLFSRKMLMGNKAIYMLRWTEAIRTVQKIKQFTFEKYILSHSGIYDTIKELAEENEERFLEHLNGFYGLLERWLGDEMVSHDELVSQAGRWYRFSSEKYEKVRVFERVIRSMIEYLEETGKIRCDIRDSLIVYGVRKENFGTIDFTDS